MGPCASTVHLWRIQVAYYVGIIDVPWPKSGPSACTRAMLHIECGLS